MNNNRGNIVRHDLVTTDPEVAVSFYSKLLGWKVKEYSLGDFGTYYKIYVKEKNIGGFIQPVFEDIPSHWIAYTTVDNVDSSAALVKQLKGRIPIGPMELPSVGRFAVSVDPMGAAINIFSGADKENTNSAPDLTEFCWNECITDDVDLAKNFYHELFKWEFKKSEIDDFSDYWIAKNGDQNIAGIMKKPQGLHAPSHWLSYIRVEDIEGKIKKVENLNGAIIVPPFNVPNIGKISIIEDSVGAIVGLFDKPVIE